MSTRVIRVLNRKQATHAGREGASALKEGKLVGFPTETVYGVAACADNPKTMERLRELKSRPTRPFSVHLGSPADAGRYVRHMPAMAARLIERSWPGPLTLVVPTGGSLADERLQKAGLHDVLCQDGLIGLRCPAEASATAMLSAVDSPVVAPSANLAGAPSPYDAADVLSAFGGRIDLLIDAGRTRFARDSTIIECRGDRWKVLREGVLDAAAIRELLYRRFLFVCTGNTCRSPMAAALAKKVLAERRGQPWPQLRRSGMSVLSAGLSAAEGNPVTQEAVDTLRENHVDIAHHRSRKLTPELIASSDMVFCMTDEQVDAARRLVPLAAGRIERLDPSGPIEDPIGGGPAEYRRAARQIEQALRARLEKDVP